MIRINLLPSGKKKVLIPPVFIFGVVATAILIVGLLILTIYLNNQVSAMKEGIFAKEKKVKELKIALKEVKNYEQDNQLVKEKTKIIEALKKKQIVPLRLLDEVSEWLPQGVWLTTLSDKGGVVSMQGYAYSNSDLVEYVQNLKGSKHMTNVMLVESRQTDLGEFSIYQFKLTFRIKV